MRKLTDFVLTHKLLVVVFWLVLAATGIATVGTTTGKLTTSFALPGQAGYETNARIDRLYHAGGAQEVTIATITLPSGSSATSPAVAPQVAKAFQAAAGTGPQALRLLDAATTGDRHFATRDGRTAYAALFTPEIGGPKQVDPTPAIAERLKAAAPAGWQTATTGITQLTGAGSSSGGAGLLVEIALGAVGALAVLAFVYASLLALLPLLMAAVAIPTTFLMVLGLTNLIDVSSVVQFLIGLIGLGVAIDYSLLVVSRWRELRAGGLDNDNAVRQALDTAGRAVILSGVTVAVSLLALAVLPVPYLRSIGFAGFFIPLTSIAVAVTLLPVLLATVGPRLDYPRLRKEADASRFWTGWAKLTVRYRWVAAAVGVAVVAALITPFFALRTGSPTSASLAQSGPSHSALTRLTTGGVPSGIITPIEVLTTADGAPAAAAHFAALPGVFLATAPQGAASRQAGTAVIDVLPT